ncbi:MAG: thioredoxin family protein, partial [Gammaproteobacteria bacterium]|nr:thioredoxin family protein [Gammaproteobacteria bacterium]
LLTRLVSEATALIAYGILALAVAGYLVSVNKVARVLAVIVAIYGGIAVVGGIVGHQDPLRPWVAKPVTQLNFIPVKTAADVQQQLAKAQGKYVLLDFYADWCVSCKIMERTVFGNPDVQAKLKDYVLLQADVTANDQQDKAVEQAFGVYGPPTILLFDPQGKLLVDGRVVGETTAKQLLARLGS